MKRFYQILAIALLPFSINYVAAEETSTTTYIPTTPAPASTHEAHKQAQDHQGMKGMHQGMGGMMSMMMDDNHLKMMQAHMLAMHELSNEILAEKDPAKKEKLKQQQLDLMKAHHAAMMSSHGSKKMQH